VWLSSASLSVGGTTCNSKAAPDEDVIAPTPKKALPINCQSGCAKHCTIKRRLDARRHSSASPMQSHKEAQQVSHHLRQAATRCKTQATATLQSTTETSTAHAQHNSSSCSSGRNGSSSTAAKAAAPQQKPQQQRQRRGGASQRSNMEQHRKHQAIERHRPSSSAGLRPASTRKGRPSLKQCTSSVRCSAQPMPPCPHHRRRASLRQGCKDLAEEWPVVAKL
jgi:hypothetical protein